MPNPEKMSFKKIRPTFCAKYNDSWTYDNCLQEFALTGSGGEKDLMRKLLRPDVIPVETALLRNLSIILQSQEVDDNCRPDCSSLVVRMLAEASASHQMASKGIPI